MTRKILYLLALCALLASCGSYDKLLKSSDNQLKLEEARNYYTQKKWLKAIGLLENIAPYYKGTKNSEEVLYLTAKSYLGNKDYYLASSFFSTYARTFPKGLYAEECQFQVGYCHYMESPDVRLDQSETLNALSTLTDYLQIYPKGQWAPEAIKYVGELQEKLAYKEFLAAKLYYDLGNYQGNNYISAEVTARNAMRDYPTSQYQEDMALLIVKSRFMQAELSIVEKRKQRYQETIEEYNAYRSAFPAGKYSKEAEKIYNDSQKELQ